MSRTIDSIATDPNADVDGPGGRTVRVLVVAGHALLRWALWRISEQAPDLRPVGEAADAAIARQLIFALSPGVVVVDCSLPESQGWRLVRDLRERRGELGIVAMAPVESDALLFRAMEAGASAFVAQTAPITEVLAAVRHAAVSAGSFSAAGLSRAVARRGPAGTGPALSPREQQVLALLRDGKSVPEVAATIHVSLSTAKTYVARLYEKLGASNRAQALMRAVDLGLFDDLGDVAV